MLKLYADEAWKPVVAPEMEFYLVQVEPDEDIPLKPPVVKLFGEHFIQTCSAIKEVEYREYSEVISPWERRFLPLHV